MALTWDVAAHSGVEIRAAEEQARSGRPEDALMLRAAAGLAGVCARLLRETGRVTGRRVVLLVGSGNNGGDALLAGVRLRRRGVAVDAVVVGEDVYEPGERALRAAGGHIIQLRDETPDGSSGPAVQALARADLVLDGVTGLSGSPGLTQPVAALFAAIPATAKVVAVDLPSGVDVETGETPGSHISADVTVTFGSWKPCLLAPPAAYAAGDIVFVDVGLSPFLPQPPRWWRLSGADVAARWPVPQRRSHKYLRGVLGVVAGSDMYPGAAVLACSGAVRSGAGIVRYVGPASATQQVLSARPEVVPGVGQVQAWLLGSGVQEDPQQDEAIDVALSSGLPCVVDAGALQACVRRRAEGDRPAGAEHILLTPHAGELARMLGVLGEPTSREEVEARPLHFGRRLARAIDVTVLVKGSITLVVNPAGEVASQDDGPPWLATAGSGDVLAGAAGALMAAGVPAMEAGAMASAVLGRAAVRASNGGPAATLDTADAIPTVVADLLRTAGRNNSWTARSLTDPDAR
jgi:ADP-dependent NAD(P)H-hydrate dehydratase / NAD(P)H-hydrate epimerase